MKERITSRTLRTMATVFLVTVLSSVNLLAQGFLKYYPSPHPVNGDLYAHQFQVYESAAGYNIIGTLKNGSFPDSVRHFSVRSTDLSGVETQAVSLFDVTDLPYASSGSNETAIVSGVLLDTSHILLAKSDMTGTLLWQKSVEILGSKLTAITDVRVADNGEIFVALITVPVVVPFSTPLNSTLAKLDADGNLLWATTEINGHLDAIIGASETLTPASDGGCYMHYGEYEYYKMVKFSNTGDILWRDSFHINLTEAFLILPRFSETGNGGIIMTAFPESYNSAFVKSWDTQGNLVWETWNFSSLMGGSYNFFTGCIIPDNDGGSVIIGQGYTQQGPGLYATGLYAAKFTPDGTQIWLKRYQDFDYNPISVFGFAGGKQTADGGYIFAGVRDDNDVLLKVDANGVLHSNLTIGTVAGDTDLDCIVGSNDIPLPNTVLQATGNGTTLWAISDANGQFEFQADTGDYSLVIAPTSYLWQPCFDSLVVNFPDTGMVQTADFPLQAISNCPLMTVDLATPRLRRCFENLVVVNYCNLGTAAAADASITITLDAGLDFNSSSIPGTQTGQEISIPLGNVGVGECGSFQIFVTPNCDSTELNQTKCITAHAFPDSICGNANNWNGATIEARAECQGDSVLFIIQNIGNGPSSTLGYVIIDDHVVMMTNDFQLDAGDQISFSRLVDGQTMRLTCQQEPGNPVATPPSVAIEACGSGLPSQGFITQFPNQTGSPFDATICRLIVGSFDPNDKIAAPEGLGPKHYIEPNTEIEYLVNFQNTGSDTAFQVVILDTLSEMLDPFTITGLTSSHNMEVKLLENKVLRFVLPQILLPDSTTNEAASHGFVRFKIKQKRDLTDGTIITNQAAIFFDFNQAIFTNEVFHEIGRDFLETVSATHDSPGAMQASLVSLSPNPADDKSRVDVQSSGITSGTCRLMDCYGRMLMEQKFDTPIFELKRNGLPAGLYLLEILSDKQVGQQQAVWSGKMIWK